MAEINEKYKDSQFLVKVKDFIPDTITELLRTSEAIKEAEPLLAEKILWVAEETAHRWSLHDNIGEYRTQAEAQAADVYEIDSSLEKMKDGLIATGLLDMQINDNTETEGIAEIEAMLAILGSKKSERAKEIEEEMAEVVTWAWSEVMEYAYA